MASEPAPPITSAPPIAAPALPSGQPAGAPASTPSAGTGAPPSTAKPELEFGLDQAFEFVDPETGQTVAMSLKDGYDAIKRSKSIPQGADPQYLADLAAAMNNDPAANIRVLERQLATLKGDQKKAETTPEIAGLNAKIAQLESQIQRFAPVADSAEEGQFQAYVGNLMRMPAVTAQLPFLAGKPEVGLKLATNVLRPLKDWLKKNPQSPERVNQMVSQALQRANSELGEVLTAYGTPLPGAAPASGGAVVTAQNQPAANPDAYNATNLLRRNMPAVAAQNGNPVPIGSNVPEAGGQGGSNAIAGAIQQNGPYTREQLLQRIKGRVNQPAGVQQ